MENVFCVEGRLEKRLHIYSGGMQPSTFTQVLYISTIFRYKYLSIFIFCDIILLLHYIFERNIVFFTSLHLL